MKAAGAGREGRLPAQFAGVTIDPQLRMWVGAALTTY